MNKEELKVVIDKTKAYLITNPELRKGQAFYLSLSLSLSNKITNNEFDCFNDNDKIEKAVKHLCDNEAYQYFLKNKI